MSLRRVQRNSGGRVRPATGGAFFDAAAESWGDLYGSDSQFKRRLELITKLIGDAVEQTSPGVALDVGCGPGIFSAMLAEAGWRVVAIDESPEMLERARRYCEKRLGEEHPVEFRETSVERLGSNGSAFDLVLCLSTLEYVEGDRAVLEKLMAAVRPLGSFVLTVPNKKSAVRRAEKIVRLLPERGTSYLRFQRHQYVPRELDAFFATAGFTKIRDVYWSVGFSRPHSLVPVFERPWWSAMYGAVYSKRMMQLPA